MFRRLNLIKSGRDGAVYGEKVIILNTFFVVWTMYQALWDSYLPKQYSHNGDIIRKLWTIIDLLCLVPEKAKTVDSLDDFFRTSIMIRF